MRKYITAISIALFMCVAFTLEAGAGQARQPIKIYRTLYRTSNILFWEKTKKTNLFIKIYDNDKNGIYDSYLWYEDGIALHQGYFYTNMESSLLEQKLINESKNGINAYFKEGCDEFSFNIPSKLNNSVLGTIKIKSNFAYKMEFQYVQSTLRSRIVIKTVPSMDTTRNRIDYYFKVKKKNPSTGKIVNRDHHIIILDGDHDNNLDYYYYIDEDLIADGKFKSLLDFDHIKYQFDHLVKQNNIDVVEKYEDKVRIAVTSKNDGKSFAYFEVFFEGEQTLNYYENPSFDNPYVTIAEKFGVSLYPNPCLDRITLITGGLFSLQATIDLYQNNIFLRNYFDGVVRTKEMAFDLSNYPSGNYQFVIVVDNEIIFPVSFIINK